MGIPYNLREALWQGIPYLLDEQVLDQVRQASRYAGGSKPVIPIEIARYGEWEHPELGPFTFDRAR
ncbi:MAG TPA: hypothetical protein VGO93_14335, partial [Candidatus Xenobia bacterium]